MAGSARWDAAEMKPAPMNNEVAKYTGISAILFAVAMILFIVQIATGANGDDNWFTRIFAAGWGAIFTSAALFLLLTRSGWRRSMRILAVVFNGVVVFVALLLVLNAIWMTA